MIKFLKKFKEKILIALACLFIGIGTLLNNTIETKAYYTDQYSYSVTYDSNKSDSTLHNASYILNTAITTSSEFTLLFNLDVSHLSSSITCYCYSYSSQINYNNDNGNTFGNVTLYPNTSTNNICTYISTRTSSICYGVSITLNHNGTWLNAYDYITNVDVIYSSDITLYSYLDSYTIQLQNAYDSLQSEYTTYQNTHAYTNEQYNALMIQNATLTQQVLSLQSQYDTYVSLHTYTNEQYNTLLNNYNNLQFMYNNLQQQYLDLQQEYNRLTIDLAPFRSAIWGNRQATLNGVTIDVSSSSNLNSVVWFRDSYLQIDQREFENFTPYIEGENDFQLVTTSDTIITINTYTAIANFSHINDYGFSIEFYLNDTFVSTTMFFHGSMTTDDGGTTNTYNYNAPITFNKMIIDVVGGPGPSTWTESSYFKANPGTWQQGYNYAVEQLTPRINDLENGLEQAISQQQIKYSEGYNAGFDARIIHNLYME